MSLLINVEDLLIVNKVEGERIEFKAGWNPNPTMRSICAFANDFANLGSGYILIGVEEENGIAKRPVKGVTESEIDHIQQELHKYCRHISPDYFPNISIEEVDDKKIVVIWIPAGSNRPYKVPNEVTAKKRISNYRIRWGSSSIIPNQEQEIELIQLTAQTPFDDRVNTQVSVNDLDFGLMRTHLDKTSSRLFEPSAKMGLAELAEKMELSAGSNEHLFPKNVGLLMFTAKPTQYVKSAYIDVVRFPEGLAAAEFEEMTFNGPIQQQLQDVLDYFKGNIVVSKVIKLKNTAESTSVFNYPFAALEEAIPNAVYHRNYEQPEPIEVRILPDKIEVISYNGIVPSLKQSDFDRGRVSARRYRNRRIGEFLKELKLTEGRGTGIPRMQNALKKNGSPPALFNIDHPNRRYFITEIPIHEAFAISSFENLNSKQKKILELILSNNEITYDEMGSKLKINYNTLRKRIDELKIMGYLKREGTKGGFWVITQK